MYSKNRNDILVYDSTGKLIQLVKFYCGANVDVTFCENWKELLKLDFETYSTAYIVINNEFDLQGIIEIYNSVEKLFVKSNIVHIKKYFMNHNDVFFFDLESDKFFIMNQIFEDIIGFD